MSGKIQLHSPKPSPAKKPTVNRSVAKYGKLILWLILGLAILLAALSAWQVLSKRTTPSAVLTLAGLPGSYCPGQAHLVVLSQESGSSEVLSDELVMVERCRIINLDPTNQLNSNMVYNFYLKLPQALGMHFQSTWPPARSIERHIEVGDTNNDNLINSQDSQAVSAALFQKADKETQNLDFDGDGQISVNDLSLTQTNRGVGAARPDNKPWQTL